MEDKKNKEIVYIPLDEIIPNRFQPRLAFDEKELNELANSILKYGVIQPIVVRQIGEKYEIIAGERRYKASTMAGIKKIPAIINNTDDNTSAEIALLENLQRKNLTVIEEAKSFKKLMDRGFKQETIASKLGISQSSIANKIRLLSLPKSVQNSLLYNKISERHARCLLTLNDEELQKQLLNRIINEKLTVKQTEEEVSKIINKNVADEIETEEKIENSKVFDPSGMKVSFRLEDMPPLEYFDARNLNEKVSSTEPKISEDIEKINDNFEKNISNKVVEETKKIFESIKNKTKDLDDDTNLEVVPSIDVLPVDDEISMAGMSPFQENERLVNQLLNKNTQQELKEKMSEPKEKPTFSGTINTIRECINNLKNEKISTTEVDMDNKYRIIIEIEKDAF